MSRGLTFQPEGFYHIYNRGTERRDIFNSEDDYDRFITLLYLGNSVEPVHFNNHRGSTSVKASLEWQRDETLVDICAYCLMPNHFHLLLHECVENGISKFMQKIMTGYTMYFNKRYERSGGLFQGKFKAQDANDDRYLKYLIAYIHLNPVKLVEPKWKEIGISNYKKAEEFLETYEYSSYPDYCGQIRLEDKLLNKAVLPDYFETPRDFKKSMAEWLNHQNI